MLQLLPKVVVDISNHQLLTSSCISFDASYVPLLSFNTFISILVTLFVTLLGAIDPPTSRDGATADAAEPVGFIVANNLFRSSSRE